MTQSRRAFAGSALRWRGRAARCRAGTRHLLVNGKIITVDARSSVREALAMHDGKITALGQSADIRKLAGPTTRVIDLGGRTVIPGPHRLAPARDPRRALVHERSELDRRALAARSARTDRRRGALAEPGAWLIVAGGWNELQFAEQRRPTQAELEAAAPGESRLRAARLRLGAHDRRRLREARHQERRGSAGRREARARCLGRADRRDRGRQQRDRRAVRSAAAADLRAASRRHQSVLPRAQSARAHGRRRSGRQQPFPERLPGALRRLAAPRDDGARRVQLERPDRRAREGGARAAHRDACRWASATTS